MIDPTLNLLRISGEDAVPFLQGQLTSPVASLLDGQAQWSTYCNRMGQTHCIGLVYRTSPTELYFGLPRPLTGNVLRSLQRRIVHAHVILEDLSDTHVCIVEKGPKTTHETYLWGTSLPARTAYGLYVYEQPSTATGLNWDAWCVEQGLVQLDAADTLMFHPLELNALSWEAVSFNKGCYQGQEIIHRLHHRGKPKQRLCQITSTEPLTAHQAWTDPASGQTYGHVFNTFEHQALVLVPTDAITTLEALPQVRSCKPL